MIQFVDTAPQGADKFYFPALQRFCFRWWHMRCLNRHEAQREIAVCPWQPGDLVRFQPSHCFPLVGERSSSGREGMSLSFGCCFAASDRLLRRGDAKGSQPQVNYMNAQSKKNIPVQFLKFAVDADNMIIPITYRNKEERPVSWALGKVKLFQKQTDKPSR